MALVCQSACLETRNILTETGCIVTESQPYSQKLHFLCFEQDPVFSLQFTNTQRKLSKIQYLGIQSSLRQSSIISFLASHHVSYYLAVHNTLIFEI